MNGITRLGIGTSLLLLGFGCSDTTSAGGAGGASTSNSTGGASSSGGSTSGTLASGGQTTSSSSTASVALGGASTTGGKSSTTSSSQPATGGALSTGGASTGGSKVLGGATGTGGKATGGTNSSAATSGGAALTGGSKALGGASSTGGVNSGGTTAVAGSKATGGTPASGGSNASGGTRTTGGVTSASTIGSPHSGEITFYDDNGNGTCSFGVTGEIDVAALGVGSWNNAAWCGACAEVSGSKGTLKVKVVNQCPSCGGAWDLDLNKAAFLKIEEERVGRYVDTWNFVPCGITTPVKYRYKEGSSSGWTAVMVSDTNLPITTLEWSTNSNNWQPTTREYYNYFLAASGFGPGFIYVRITAIDGQQLIDQLPPVEPGLVFTGESNFQ